MAKKLYIFGDVSTWNLTDFDVSHIDSSVRKAIETADGVIYNLEGPVASEEIPPFRFRESLIADIPFKILSRVTGKSQPLVASSSDIFQLGDLNSNTTFTLANNHTKDSGKKALLDTVHDAKSCGIESIGWAQNKGDQHDFHEILEDIVVLNYNWVGSYKYGLPFHLYDATVSSYGAAYLSASEIRKKVSELHSQKKSVILILHAGKELKNFEEQEIDFEAVKNIGSDITVIHQSHLYLPSRYESDNIFLLGDFIFHRPGKLDPDRPSAYLEVLTQDGKLTPSLKTGTPATFYQQ